MTIVIIWGKMVVGGEWGGKKEDEQVNSCAYKNISWKTATIKYTKKGKNKQK